MPSISIPMKTSATSGSVAYDTAVDAAYTVYNATLKDYPVANAFVDGANTSQVKWGLQIAARATQNTAWKAQLTYGVASGTGALAPYSITYGFARTISKLEAGNIQTMFYQNGFPTVHFDETLNSISTVRNGGTTANTAITTGTQNVKWYIATNTNKFLAICDGATLKTFPVDANYAVTSSTPAGTATVPNCVDGWVVAAKGIYIWVVSLIQTPTGTAKNNQWKGQLYSISTAGVLSTVGAQVVIYTSPNGVDTGEGMYGRLNGLGSYVVNNVSHVISSAVAQSGNQPNAMRSRIYNTVDLATVTVFTTTAVKQESVGANNSDYLGIGIAKACLNVGYDGSFGLVVTNLGTAGTPDVYKVNAAGGFVDAAVNYFDTYLNPCRYRNTTTKLSTAASNTNVSATNTFRVDDTALAGGTFTNLHLNCIWMYEMTGTNAEDDTGTTSLKGVYLGCSALGSSSGNMTLKVNGTLALTKTWNNINITASNMNWTFTSVLDIATTKLTFLTEFANSLGLDCKIGYGTNGGTYATPTGTFELSSITVLLT